MAPTHGQDYDKAHEVAMEEKYLAEQKHADNNANDAEDADLPLQQSAHGNPHAEDDDGDRETWGKKVDFLLSVIGFAVDLANVWRFPYLCYKNGGGAFLIPYTLMLALGGIPLFYMELALGQYMRKGAITCWGRVCPLFKGIGWAVVLIAFYTDFFYNVIISWALYFFFASFTKKLPWTSCDNAWNTDACSDEHLKNTSDIYKVYKRPKWISNETLVNGTLGFGNYSVLSNETLKYVSPAEEYFTRGVLELYKSSGLDDLGSIKWQLVLCLLAVYVICYFSLWKGISTSGKVVWFTAVFPYIVLFILLIRGVTLPGAGKGIKYYLTPTWERLLSSTVWVDAATQVFFSLGPGFGVLLAFSSYNKFHNNVYRDAIATSIVNCATSFLSGFVIFSVLGYMAYKTDQKIEEVATEGPGLVFTVYPEAIATLPGSTFWSLLFFLMLLTLGLDSSFGGSEAIITAVSDEIPIVKKHREIFVGGLFGLYFVIGLASCTYGGMFVVTLMERFAAGYSILIAVFFETLVVSWFYGVSNFCDDIKQMMGFSPGMYWRICWAIIAPIFILFIVIFGLVTYEPVKYEEYIFPWWAELIGWLMALSSILCIPGFAIYALITTEGDTFKDRLRNSTMPWKVRQKLNRLNGTKKGADV